MDQAIVGYRLGEMLAETIDDALFRGQREQDGAPVLLKVAQPGRMSPALLARYERELALAQSRDLDLPFLVRAKDLERAGTSAALILESCEGAPLSPGKSAMEIVKIATICASHLGELHRRRWIHGNVSPLCFLFDETTDRVKLTGASASASLALDRFGVLPPLVESALPYMSPEQTGRMNRAVDYRTDMYSFGVTLYFLLTARLPFDATDALELVHCHIAKQPIAPAEIDPTIPAPLSDIVMKLLAKTAEDRYQTMWGLAADLDTCLAQMRAGRGGERFALGLRDVSDRFRVPQRLYGRKDEINTIWSTLGRVSLGKSAGTNAGAPELLLIAGRSGIGKTALVYEVQRPLAEKRGYFAAGKFDELARDVPYRAFVTAFSGLVRQVLTEDQKRLAKLKAALVDALGPNARLLADVIPQIELVTGPLPKVAPLGLLEAQHRFNAAFQQFVRVFCSEEHPLVLFIDDLQWADSASRGLIKLLLTGEEMRHLLLIGSYRDNLIDDAHPLRALFKEIEGDGVPVSTLVLRPLHEDEIEQLVADALSATRQTVAPLAALVAKKTAGNPFFINQFLETLSERGLLVFKPPQDERSPGGFSWDIGQIEAMNITDNVVELMIEKLRRLPDATQQVVQIAACFGSRFDLDTLALASERTARDTLSALSPALEEGLVISVAEPEAIFRGERADVLVRGYRFLHDRVQQAAYALLDQEKKKEKHLFIGKMLLASIPSEERASRIFEVIDHVNIARALLTEQSDRIELARLNLLAGRKAKSSTAYAAAKHYLGVGLACLPSSKWESLYDLSRDLTVDLAEVEYLLGDFDASEALCASILESGELLDKAEALNLLIVQRTMAGKYAEAIADGKRALALLGYPLPEADLDTVLTADIAEAKRRLGDRPILSLLDGPFLTERPQRIALKTLKNLGAPTYIADQALFRVSNLRAVHISLEYGSDPESILGYSNYGLILSSMLGDHRAGYDFGVLAMRLADKLHDVRQKGIACFMLANVLQSWVLPAALAEQINEDGYRASLESGELLFAGYISMARAQSLLFCGKDLGALREMLHAQIAFTTKTKNQYATDLMSACLLPVKNLLAETADARDFSAGSLTEEELLTGAKARYSLAGVCLFGIFKAWCLYLHGDADMALPLILETEAQLVFIPGYIAVAEHNFVCSLILARTATTASEEDRAKKIEKIQKNQEQMAKWAESCHPNFDHRYQLVQGELARLRGDLPGARSLFEKAIREATEQNFPQNAALGEELLSAVCFAEGEEAEAATRLRKAHRGYLRWGALRVAREMERRFAHWLSSAAPAEAPISAAGAKERWETFLDLKAILKAYQAIAGEIHMKSLLQKVMTAVIEQAGAEKGVLLLDRENDLRIEAEHTAQGGEVLLARPLSDANKGVGLSLPIVSYVARTGDTLLLDNAVESTLFGVDPYVSKHRVKSVLCLPLTVSKRRVGILYLENNLSVGAFRASHLEALRLLAAQAAISLENARLYESLEEYNRTLMQKVEERTQEIVRAQRRLKMQEKMAALGVLAAGVAHEIRNPLNFINNFAEIAGEQLSELQEEVREASASPTLDALLEEHRSMIDENLTAIRRHGGRAAQIVDSMAAYAESGVGELRPTDLNNLLSDEAPKALSAALVKYPGAVVTLVTELDPEAGQVALSRTAMSRVLNNLIQNAVEALEEKRERRPVADFAPRITVSTHDRQDLVEIRVRDNGPGITEQIKDKIFTPLFTTKTTGSGNLGLGLSICYNLIVDGHGGEISAQSSPGQYTEIVIHLPRTAHEKDAHDDNDAADA